MRDLKTNHHAPWALIRRAGDTVGKRPSTRMAYLKSTIAPEGRAIALTGYIMRTDMTGWTKSVRRIEWGDVIRRWRHQPTAADVRKAKSRLKVIRSDDERMPTSAIRAEATE